MRVNLGVHLKDVKCCNSSGQQDADGNPPITFATWTCEVGVHSRCEGVGFIDGGRSASVASASMIPRGLNSRPKDAQRVVVGQLKI
jgi:hypothetical protein